MRVGHNRRPRAHPNYGLTALTRDTTIDATPSPLVTPHPRPQSPKHAKAMGMLLMDVRLYTLPHFCLASHTGHTRRPALPGRD